MQMIQQVSVLAAPPTGRRSPVAGWRSPLADVLAADSALEAMLRDLDVTLVFAFVDLPRKSVGTPPADLLPDVDEAAIDRLRSRRANLVIDHSSEGPRHTAGYSELLHAWCTLHSVSPSALVYVNTNLEYPKQYEAWCDAQGHAERYTFVYFNAYVEEVAAAAGELDPERTEPMLLHSGPRTYRFLNFNNATRPERLLVAAHMLSVDPADALVSLGSGKDQATPERSLELIATRYKAGRLVERHPRLFETLDFGALRARTTLGSPDPMGEVPLYRRFDLEHYARSYISVVTETEMSGGQVKRVTEKAIKPFLFGHPAIVAGNPGALGMVREMGFESFAPYIDESYDEIPESNERLCAVLCEIDRIRDLGDRQVHDLFMDLEDVRRTNLRHGHDVLGRRQRLNAQQATARHIRAGARI